MTDMQASEIIRELRGIRHELHSLVEAMKLTTNATINGMDFNSAVDERIETFTEKIIKKAYMNGDKDKRNERA